MGRRRTAVLISGSGSNLQALIDDTRRADAAAEIVLVVSNVADAFGLARARRAGLPTRTLAHHGFADRAAFDAALDAVLRDAGIELVCLAGFMRLLTPGLVAAWRDRMLNIHPSLLPAFRGLGAQAKALAAGVRIAGCTVHIVRAEMDAGPIILQGLAPVLPGDGAETLAARILEVEHRSYPRALELVASGRARVVGERVEVAADPGELLVLHPLLTGPGRCRGGG
jgi:phosphoribosylglycinamide formyltransferase-1